MKLIHRSQDPPYAVERVLIATWPDGCLFRRIVGWQDEPIFEIRGTFTRGSGHLEMSKSDFSLLEDGSVTSGRFNRAILDGAGRIRWAMDLLGLVDRSRTKMFVGGSVNGQHAAVDPVVIRLRRRGGAWSREGVLEVARAIADHNDEKVNDRLLRLDPDLKARLQAVLDDLVAGLGLDPEYLLTLGIAEDNDQIWLAIDLRRADDWSTLHWTQQNRSIEWLWNDLMFGEKSYLLCESNNSRHQWRVALVPYDEYDAWVDARLEPGTLSVPREELDVFQMLGEPLPYLWPEAKLLEWAAERETGP